MTPTPPRPSPGLMIVRREYPAPASTGWGWTIFASFVMLMGAALLGIWGVVSIATDDYWGGDQAVAGHEALWGWLWIGFAFFQSAVAIGVLFRNAFAIVLGIALAIITAVAQVIGFDNYPIWSGVILALDALVLWALIRHGFDS